jgi:hypothetical protein
MNTTRAANLRDSVHPGPVDPTSKGRLGNQDAYYC